MKWNIACLSLMALGASLVAGVAACGGDVTTDGASSTSGAGGAAASTTRAATTGSGAGGAAECGGDVGLGCAADEWCDFPHDDCGAADAPGVCRKRPRDCTGPTPTKPACGCDGNTYSDACHAELAGFDIAAHLACPSQPTFACGDSLSCKTGEEYCVAENGVVLAFACKPLPASCLPPNTDDCSCMPISPQCGGCTGHTGEITEAEGCG